MAEPYSDEELGQQLWAAMGLARSERLISAHTMQRLCATVERLQRERDEAKQAYAVAADAADTRLEWYQDECKRAREFKQRVEAAERERDEARRVARELARKQDVVTEASQAALAYPEVPHG